MFSGANFYQWIGWIGAIIIFWCQKMLIGANFHRQLGRLGAILLYFTFLRSRARNR